MNIIRCNKQNKCLILIASAFGLGLSPIAPGTCGALLGVIAHILIWTFTAESVRFNMLLLLFLIICVLHYFLTPWAVNYWRNKDPKNFVLDEIAGYLLVPILFHHGQLWQVACWGFLWFRLFDIIKLPVAKQIDEKMHGALGILLDDLVSACYAVGMLYILKFLGSQFGLEQYLISE